MEEIEMKDISQLSHSQQEEIAGYIKRDNLETVNKNVVEIIPKKTFYTKYGKRILDIIISLLAIIITLPINLIIAVVTYFDVGSPIIFSQERMGKDERIFVLYKFRNMTNETDANGELLPAAQRVTKWGKFVRKTSLDELLNFVSILKGDMSIIGPRPVRDFYLPRLNNRHKGMYKVRPGLECPTPYKVDHFLTWQERFDNYAWYAENCSFLLDIKLCFRLVAIVFDHKSTKVRSNVSYGSFMGYEADGNAIYTKSVPDRFVEEFLRAHGYQNLDEAAADRFEKNC